MTISEKDTRLEEKAGRFFNYLLSLNNLVRKVVRDYTQFEKNWKMNELNQQEGIYILEDCKEEVHVMEIHRPTITDREKIPPAAPAEIKNWLNFDYHKETARPAFKQELVTTSEDGEKITETFSDDPDREHTYETWLADWKEWAGKLAAKRKVHDLYSEFFELISQLEQEGESLEFIMGRGMFCWDHPDQKIGRIRSPLLTTKLELDLDADRGVITAEMVDEEIKVEREMLANVQIPNSDQINELIRDVETRDITDDLSDFFQQFIHYLDASGKFVPELDKIKMQDTPIIYDDVLFSLRRKNVRILRDDLEQIIDGLSEREIELTPPLRSLLGEEPADTNDIQEGDTTEKVTFTENSLYFPLASNEQQKEIVRRIEHNYGVTVQGPPGTGKTHTIANLVSHFLAEGKKILITSQKESPLKVLKNKIPEEIRDLCVPVLGGGRESMQEIEQSIRTISEQLGELDVSKLAGRVAQARVALETSKRTEAELTNKLKVYAEKEGTQLTYKGEKLFKYDVAKRLAESPVDYQWIQDEVAMDVDFPLNKNQFTELWQLKQVLSKKDLLLKDQFLPVTEKHIPNAHRFTDMVKHGQELKNYDEEGSAIIEKYQLPEDEQKLTELRSDLQDLNAVAQILDNGDYQMIFKDLQAGGARERRWRDFVTEQTTANQQLFTLYNNLITHSIQLPNKPLSELENDVAVAKERLETGKKPGFFFFAFKGKGTKYLFQDPVINNHPVRAKADLVPIEQHLQHEALKQKTMRIVNGNMKDAGLALIQETDGRFPHRVDEILKELAVILQVTDRIQSLLGKLSSVNVSGLDFYAVKDVQKFQQEVEIAIQYLHSNHWRYQFNEQLTELKKLDDEKESNPILQQLITAFEQKDVPLWEKLLQELEGLHRKKENVLAFFEILKKFNQTLPLTGKAMELTAGGQQVFPEDYEQAFELKKLQTWLDETKDMNVAKLKEQIEAEHDLQRQLVKEVVSNATWKNQVERITDKEKRALSAWKTYIKRFGKGSGKYAQKHLQDAREEMKTAQNAIPVWIMPVSQVLENFPVANEKFDVVIFDESSQCDLFSVNVLLRGEKMIVVGDDEQISPQSIGIEQDQVYNLVHRYLPDIPNANLFDGNISLYEIAEQTFPKEGKLMLKEHFRCVPEIIQFSNDLSYGGEMIPLRLPLEDEKLDPPVTAIKVMDGYNDAKEKDVNVAEIDAIVQDMEAMIQDPKYADQTFGVITLQGQKQHRLMETRIREAIGDREFVKRKIICGNAYTLQGDERDIIFLSMVVAPNRRFRAFTKSTEKQRFNVAASRAKNQMRLYHSVELEELSPDDLRYQLLSYCKNPTRVNEQMENLEDRCESPFELDVLRMILAKGYKVTPQVQVGRYRIDLVVEGIRDRLAVECDGEKWHGPEKFEADMQRQDSLERSSWKFWRIRGREFYFDREAAMESLWETLDDMGIERSA